MWNSRFELSKIERKNKSFRLSNSQKSRVEREFVLHTLEDREWKDNFFLPLSKIESGKRIVSLSTHDSTRETLVNAWNLATMKITRR